MSKLYTCTLCNKKKPKEEFYLRKSGTVGEYKCKQCLREKRKSHYIDNYEQVRKCNREVVSKWQRKNRAAGCAKAAKYSARKKGACPEWLSKDDISKMKSVYKMCRQLSKKTGIRHEVDHIVPLNGKEVSGLHVPWNLQVITAEENKKKSNSLIEDIVCS